MKTTLYNLLTIIFLVAGNVIASGQHLSDSLYGYLEVAARNNPGVRQKFIEYQAALQKVPQAGSLPDPEISAGILLKPMELISGNQVADLRLMQMFPWFGVLKDARDEMSLMAKAKFELFRDSKAQVYYDVLKTWYELFRTREETRISEKNIEILKTIERLSLVKFMSASSGNIVTPSSGTMPSGFSQGNNSANTPGMQGMGENQAVQGTAASAGTSSSMQSSPMGYTSGGPGLSDLYRIGIEVGELENNIALLKNQELTIVARFNSYLNRNPTSPVFTDQSLITDSLAISEMTVQDSILENNPMLGMLEYEKQSLEARKGMITGMGYPMVGIGVNYSLINKSPMSSSPMNGTDMIMPMVTVTLPVYRRKYNAMKNEAEMLKSATEQNYNSTANSLRTEFYSAFQLYRDAMRRAALYKNQHILASKSLDLMLKDFSTSASSLTDVLRIRQQMLDFELKLVESNVDLNISLAWIRRLMASTHLQ